MLAPHAANSEYRTVRTRSSGSSTCVTPEPSARYEPFTQPRGVRCRSCHSSLDDMAHCRALISPGHPLSSSSSYPEQSFPTIIFRLWFAYTGTMRLLRHDDFTRV